MLVSYCFFTTVTLEYILKSGTVDNSIMILFAQYALAIVFLVHYSLLWHQDQGLVHYHHDKQHGSTQVGTGAVDERLGFVWPFEPSEPIPGDKPSNNATPPNPFQTVPQLVTKHTNRWAYGAILF